MSEKENLFAKSSGNIDWLSYSATEQEAKLARENEGKYLQFKERISKFEDIATLEEAQILAKQIIPTAQELTQFKIGFATCSVVNKPNMLRISLDSDKEFICYDFV